MHRQVTGRTSEASQDHQAAAASLEPCQVEEGERPSQFEEIPGGERSRKGVGDRLAENTGRARFLVSNESELDDHYETKTQHF